MKLRRVDLNLFRVFEAVMQYRSIVVASRALSITPSAVSHALARLRVALDDPLFVAGEQGMEPTPRALELAPHVQGGLERIDLALRSAPFVPATAVRTFRVAMSDYASTTLLPRLLADLSRSAPRLDLRIFPFCRPDTVQQLDDGRLDIVIGWFGGLPPRLRRRLVWRDQESIVARRGHPITCREVTREALFDYPHVVVELSGSGDSGDDGFLEERGVTRRVWIERLLLDTREGGDDGEALVGRAAVSVPHYAAVIPIVLATDMLATLPHSYVEASVRNGAVVRLPLPYAPVVGQLEAIWHERNAADAALAWLVEQFARTSGIEAEPALD